MKRLAKYLALILSLLMIVSLFACKTNGNGADSGNSSGSETSSAPESAGAPDSAAPESAAPESSESGNAPKLIGYYDREFDYSACPRYKVVYMMVMQTTLHTSAIDAMKIWANLMNIDYSSWDASNDNDLFITSIETMAASGVDGLILDPDTTYYDRVTEVATEAGIAWIPGMGAPFVADESGNLALTHPFVGFDDYAQGIQLGEWMYNYKEEAWPNVPWSDFGILWVDFSGSPQIHTLGTAALSYVNDNAPETVENTVSVDGVTGNLSSDTAYNLVVATVPNYGKDYWIIFTPFDDYAIGAARAMESLGKADNTAITTRGGTAICAMWDTGEQNSIKSALFVAATIVTEYNVAGLWAMMSGLATPETLWPEWIDHSSGAKYAHVNSEAQWLTFDMYKRYLEWSDLYTQSDMYPYNDIQVTLDEFSARSTPPASYAG